MVLGWPARASAQVLPDVLVWSVFTAGPPVGGPVISGSMIVVPLHPRAGSGESGAVAGHHLADGAHVWTTELAAEKPLAADAERVYVAAGEAIHALDSRTGAVQWRVPLGGAPTAAPLTEGGWLIAAAAGQVLAVRTSDGAVIWRQQTGPVEFRPALDGDLLVVSVIDAHVLALDVQTGAERWRCDLGSSPSEPLVIGGRVYVGSHDKRFYTIDARSGRILSPQFVGARVVGRAAVDERHVYFAALDNVLWAVDRGHGAIKWRQGLKYRPAAGPAVLAGRVLVPGRIDTLPAFDAVRGTVAGSIAFPARLVQLPLLTPTDDGSVLAIGVTGSLENKWSLLRYGPLLVAPIVVLPLTELPGVVVTLPAAEAGQ